MSEYITIVVRMPEDEPGKAQIREGLGLLSPFQTGMSMEDEMTTLELIEAHEDFPEHVGWEARQRTAELHTKARTATLNGEPEKNVRLIRSPAVHGRTEDRAHCDGQPDQ